MLPLSLTLKLLRKYKSVSVSSSLYLSLFLAPSLRSRILFIHATCITDLSNGTRRFSTVTSSRNATSIFRFSATRVFPRPGKLLFHERRMIEPPRPSLAKFRPSKNEASLSVSLSMPPPFIEEPPRFIPPCTLNLYCDKSRRKKKDTRDTRETQGEMIKYLRLQFRRKLPGLRYCKTQFCRSYGVTYVRNEIFPKAARRIRELPFCLPSARLSTHRSRYVHSK